MNDKTYHIVERFPDRSHDISLLVAGNPEFLALCEDYDVCINALRYWEKSEEPEAESRFVEYSTLAQELEKEVAEALMELKPPQRD
jgi:hypothetical protein